MTFRIGDKVRLELMPPGVTGRVVEVDEYGARVEWSDTDEYDNQWWYFMELERVES